MSDIAHTSLTRSQIVDEILRLNDVEERQAAEIDRLRERCDAYKGQVWAGEQEIERLRAALRKVRAIVMDDTADPLGSLDTIDQALKEPE